MVLRLLSTLLVSALVAACIARGSVVSTGEKPANVGGTVSGIVRASADNSPLSGRKVTVTNVETGETHEGSTAVNGGYTIKVPTGHYRLDVELRSGEALSKRPDDVHITASDLDASRDFFITVRPSPRR